MAIIASGTTSTGQTIANGGTLTVAAGGTIDSYSILSGGSAVISGVDSGTTISAGGQELVISGGTATGDQIYGLLTVSNTPSTADDETVYTGGTLFLTGSVLAEATTIAGGTVILDSTNAGLTSGVSFTGSGGVLSIIPMSKAPAGVTGVISGFGVGDEIVVSGGAAVSLTSGTTIVGGSTLEVITANYTFTSKTTTSAISESFTFASNALETYTLTPSTAAGAGTIGVSTTTNVTGAITGGTVISGVTATVQLGGSVTSDTVAAGGIALIDGTDTGATIALGGTETVFGTASDDLISGTETVSGSDTANTIALGGTEIVTGSASADLILGTEILSGSASNLTLNGGTLELASGTASLTGGLSFTGQSTVEETALIASGDGVSALIAGFGTGDVIDLSAIGTGATLTSATSGANAVISIAGGSTEGGSSESFTFANAAGSIFSLGSISGGEALSIVNPIITVSAGQTSTGDVASANYQLNVLATGTEVSGQILSGGTASIAGVDENSTIALGGTETVLTGGSASGDAVFGGQIVSGTASGETVGGTGALTAVSGGTVSNIILSGGSLELAAGATLSGGITFAGDATLKEDGLTSPTALITGFDTTDSIDLSAIGTGAIITSTTIDGNTVLTISGGSGEDGADLTMTMAGTGNLYALGTDASGTGETLTAVPLLTSFTAGDIVVGVVGDDNDTADYGDNQAAPIALEEYTASGQLVGEMVLSDNNSTLANGTVEYGISGEYGSSSEGILQLAGDGESIVIAGYNVNYTDYNAAEAEGGINNYGTAALAQTTSVTDQDTLTPVARVIANIGADGSVDTSTALYNIYNTNNPRSVTTVDGKVFYISGQGDKDDTQGVFVADDGADSATAIDTTTDTRDIEIYDGKLYVSQNSSEGTSNIETFGTLPVDGVTTPSILSGINTSVTLTAAQENSVNASAVGTAVALSPEQYFFANATTLYVADSGDPKAGTLGDGGLQKWILDTTTGQWQLAYTLSAGLNLVPDTDTAGTTGLIGLTGVLNADGTVTFYATNATIGDLDQTYVYTITDTVSATTAASGESFTLVTTAAADTNDRGIALAPSAAANVTVTSGETSTGLTVSTGSTVTVAAGGTLSGAVILSGGMAYVAGSDTGSLIVADGGEIVYGTATGDNVYGTQIVSGGVSSETVYYGATLEVAAGGTADAITTEVNGVVEVSGTLADVTLSGGAVSLDAAGASVSGVTFAGAAEITELVAGTSVSGVISGFGVGDVIDLEQMGTAAVLTATVSGGNTVETVTSGGISQSFTLAGAYAAGVVTLQADGNGGVDIAIGGSTVTGTEEVTSGEFGADITIASGGTLQVDAGGTVTQDVILTGGTATINGIASDDVISGSETVASGALVGDETVTGGTLVLQAGADADGVSLVTGTLVLNNDALLGGTLALGSAATLVLESSTTPGAVISGFVSGDVIDITAMTTGATLTSSTSGGDTIETVTSGGVSESFTFAGTSYASGYFVLDQSASGDTLTTLPPTSAVVSSGQTSAGFTVTSGFTLDVLSGGTATAPIVLSGGTANILGTESGAVVSSGGTLIISSGGVENGATILAGGTETLIGPDSATGDQIYGLQQITSANGATGTTLNNETIFSGGEVDILFKTNTLENSTILSGGLFAINGNATGLDLTLAGGTIEFESPKANLTGTLDFESGTLLISGAVISAGYGDIATIEGFGAGDVIELAGFDAGALSSSTASGNTIETITSGSVTESFTFAGTGSSFSVLTLAGGGVEILANTSVVSSGSSAGGTITSGQAELVLSGGTITGGTITSGGIEIISSGGVASDTTVINGGTQTVLSGGIVSGATVSQDSTQIISSGGTVIDTTAGDPSPVIVSAGGTATGTTLTAGGELDVYGSVTSTVVDNGGTEILYTGGSAADSLINNGGTLVLSGGTASDTTLSIGATVIDEGISYTSGMTGTITGDELLVSNAGGTVEFSLQLDGSYTGDTVNVAAAADGSLELTLCFYPGTGIATPAGVTAVEDLRAGDLVLTENGALPVRWIGQSHIDTRFGDKRRSLPIRITQGALGKGLPARDLLLSPGHAVFIGGILAHASALVNGESIIQEHDVPQQFTYYHVELATHELLLAEGVQAESFVDNVDRMHFHNWDEREAPRAPIAEMAYPRARAQRQLPQAVRRMIAVAKRA